MDEGIRRSHALAARIARLPHPLQVAFAAGCAERVLPLLEYEGYPAGPDFLPAFRAAVEAVWAAAAGSPVDPDTIRAAVEAVFPEGDHYAGFDGTVGAGAAILRAVDAVDDPSGRAAADAGLHTSSAYEQATQWDDEPTDDMGWQEQVVGVLEGLRGRAVAREVLAGLTPPPKLGAE